MKILFLSNNLTRTGAPLVLLNFLKWLKNIHSNVISDVIAFESGAMQNEFKNNCRNLFVYKKNLFEKIIIYLNPKFSTKTYCLNPISLKKYAHYDIVYANTVVTIPLAIYISKKNNHIKTILHIHELDYAINYHIKNFGIYINKIDHFIAVSEKVKNNSITNYSINKNKVSVSYPPSFINKISDVNKTKNKFVVGGSGQVRWEKGFDLFVQLAINIKKKYNPKRIQFTWVGNFSEIDYFRYNQEIIKAGINDIIRLEGEVPNVTEYFSDFDVFVLTSREDPFPLVCIEAGMLGKPIICFEGASGTEEVLKNGGGFIVPYLDIDAMVEKIIFYYKNKDILLKDGQKSKELFSHLTPENQYPKLFEEIKNTLK